MHALWWQLPSPSEFVKRICQDLQDGRNVIACIPDFAPAGMLNAIQARLEIHAGSYWASASVDAENVVMPADYLFQRFVPHADPSVHRNARTLAQEESFSGRLIQVTGISPEHWPSWREFLTEYADYCQARDELDRTLFLVLLQGSSAAHPTREHSMIACRRWQGVVSRLDMLLFATHCFRSRQLPRLERELAISLTTMLAGVDPVLCQSLAKADLIDLMAPKRLLQELAAQRGWQSLPLENCDVLWYMGILDQTCDNEDVYNSLALAYCDPTNEISRRVWHAEVQVMLPFIEQKRRQLLSYLHKWLMIPYRPPYGEPITDLLDLEIGHIDKQVNDNGSLVDRPLRRLIRKLKDARNQLSHLEPLDPAHVIDANLEMRFPG